MEAELKSRLIAWVKSNENDYRRECGIPEYRQYLIVDALAEFSAGGDEDLREEIVLLCSQVLNGDL